MLDHLSNGRFILGLGRGLGRVEFEGLGVDMNASRELFVESAEMILDGLERGYCEYDGQVHQAGRGATSARARSRASAAAPTPRRCRPSRAAIMARLGLGLLIIPQKPWDVVADGAARPTASIYQQVNGAEAPPPIVAGWTFCDEDAGRAEEMARKYIGGYWQTVIEHYEIVGDHLTKTKGYESLRRACRRSRARPAAPTR